MSDLRKIAPSIEALWRYSRKGLVAVAGGALIAGGVAMLVLPGPGLLVIIAGLAVLAREFVWAERALHAAKRKATAGAQRVKRGARRAVVAAEAPEEAAVEPAGECAVEPAVGPGDTSRR